MDSFFLLKNFSFALSIVCVTSYAQLAASNNSKHLLSSTVSVAQECERGYMGSSGSGSLIKLQSRYQLGLWLFQRIDWGGGFTSKEAH